MIGKLLSTFTSAVKAATQSPAPAPASPATPGPQAQAPASPPILRSLQTDAFEKAKKLSWMPDLTGDSKKESTRSTQDTNRSKESHRTRRAKEDPGDGAEGATSSTWRVRIVPNSEGLVNLRADPGTGGAILGTLEDGTELEVLETERRGNREWMRVRTPDGQEGWIISERTEHVSGIARSYPYVLEDGRDGSGSTALNHALEFVSADERAELQARFPPGQAGGALGGLMARIPEGNTTNWGTGYADDCLGFVNDCFGISQAADRAPHMYNPAGFLEAEQLVAPPLDDTGAPLDPAEREVLPEGQIYSDLTGSAYGAWLALEGDGLVTEAAQGADGSPILTTPLEEGTILFFGPSELNGNAGHTCIATGMMAPDGTPLVVTSGTGDGGVMVMSLAEMQAWTGGEYLGHTTPDQAFQEGRFGGATIE